MMWLLCPDCFTWRKTYGGQCEVCGAWLDIYAADPSRDEIAKVLGNWRETLGEFEVKRCPLPIRGTLHLTTSGMLFVPHFSSLFVFDDDTAKPAAAHSGLRSMLSSWMNWLLERMVRGHGDNDSLPLKLLGHDSVSLADLLLSDVGVMFTARASITTWRRTRRHWEFCRSDGKWLPEQLTSSQRESHQQLQNWLEATACPLLLP